eukprot:m.163046 g.163046  ORF g.163046 m.163046 type:complete len:1042 (+) comp16388_c0_seq78:297-3422(+)
MPPSRKESSECNIQVAVRCRPLNTKEIDENSPSIIECSPPIGKLTVQGLKYESKTFSYDHVFGPEATQLDVYRTLVEPLLDEVLTGFNCTVFAYGQTGTGKTHTMEGYKTGDFATYLEDPGLGIIPRALHQLFEKLEVCGNEYSVRVSFLEIYNEELFDLLSASDQKLRLFEDARNKGSVVIQGLEEVIVKTANEVFGLIQQGADKRRTSETKMNKSSSRSHSVFSVTIHQKESSLTGEELLKTGKLYLVDLAGSENIGRSGAVKDRAREAGNINQSLLTLGRVIQKLVQKEGHIPYRESKLTRLLQDSLGGKTKTSIVATISPAMCNLEETLSTLDYAFHAKNIKNRPEINQKLTKKALIKEYTDEIDRLKKDLLATRSKNGIYVDQENYEAMETKIQAHEEKIAALEQELTKTVELFDTTSQQLEATKVELEETTSTLVQTKSELHTTTETLKERTFERDRTQFLVEAHVATEQELSGQAQQLLDVADITTTHVDGLHGKIERKQAVEEHNQAVLNKLREEATQSIDTVRSDIRGFAAAHAEKLESMMSSVQTFTHTTQQHLQATTTQIQSLASTLQNDATATSIQAVEAVAAKAQEGLSSCVQLSTEAFEATTEKNRTIQSQFSEGKEELLKLVFKWTPLELRWVSLGMDALKSMIDQQNEAFKAFIKTMLTTFNDVHASTMSFVEQQQHTLQEHQEQLSHAFNHAQEELQQHSESVTRFAEETNTTVATEVEQLKDDVAEMLASFVARMQSKTSATATSFAERTNSLAMSMSDQHQALTQQITEQQASLSAFADKTISTEGSVMDVLSSTEREMDNTCTTLEASQAHLLDDVCSGIETVSANVAEAQQAMATRAADVAGQTAVAVDTGLSHISEMMKSTVSHCVTVQRGVEDISEQVNTFQSQQEALAQDLHSTAEQGLVQMDEHLGGTQSFVDQMVTQEIRKDLPTGTTPAKQAYVYPRALAATRPHPELFEHFSNLMSIAETAENDAELNADASEDETETENITTCLSSSGIPKPTSSSKLMERRTPLGAVNSSS